MRTKIYQKVGILVLLLCFQMVAGTGVSVAQDTTVAVHDSAQTISIVPDSAVGDSSGVNIPLNPDSNSLSKADLNIQGSIDQLSQSDTILIDSITYVKAKKNGEQANPGEDPTDIAILKELISFRKIALTIFVLVFTYFATNIIVRVLDTISEKFSSYRLFIKRLVPVTRIVIWIIAIYIIIQGIINPPLETIVAFTATVGIAVGFASQDILKNIFGGIMIILDRPFQVGDKISVGEHYGEVTQIGLRSSRMVTADDSVVAIPNAEIMNKSVSNTNSGALDCLVVAEIYLPADIDLQLIKSIARRAAVTSWYVFLKKPVTIVAVNEMHERKSMIKLRIKAYVLDIRYEFLFQSDMTEIMMNELNRRDINHQIN